MPKLKSREARIAKMADVVSNLRAIAVSPPADWSAERKLGYLEGCGKLVDASRGADAALARRLRAMIDNLMKSCRNSSAGSSSGACRTIEKIYPLPEDLAAACIADTQGLGGSSGAA